MNKHQRVRAAIEGADIDSVPSAFWLHFPPAQAFGEGAVQAHLDFYKDTDVDILKVMNEALYRNDGPVVSPAEWARWKPIRAHDPHFQRFLDVVKGVADHVGNEVPLLATIHGTFISAFHGSKCLNDTIQGPNVVTEHLRASPAAVVPALRVVAESLTELSLACLEAGAHGIYYGAQGGEAHRFDEDTFVEFVKPWDLVVMQELVKHTNLLVLHICKDHVRLPLYADYPCHAANWAVHDGDYSLSDGRAIFTKAILGGLDDRSGVMVDGSEADIAKQVHDIIWSFGKRGFILGADCTLPTEIPRDHIRAAVSAARNVPPDPGG